MSSRNKKYILHVRTQDVWVRVCEIEAQSRREAFRIAMTKLKPEDYNKEIRIELKDGEQQRDEAK